MNDITEIEGRLAAALERMAQVAERMPESGDGQADRALAEAREELEAERGARAALAEAVEAARRSGAETAAALEERAGRLDRRVAEQAADLARLRAANAALRETAAALRAAAAEGSVDAGVLEGEMAAELEATRAAQASDRAELEAILAELRPLIGEDGHV